MVEGARASTIIRRRQRSVESDAPPPPFGWSPSPAFAGADDGADPQCQTASLSHQARGTGDLVLAMRLRIRGLLHALRKPVQRAPNKRRGAERRKARTELPCPAGPGARHTSECCHPSALRARSPFGAPPRHSPVGLRQPAQPQAMLPGTRVGRALPALAYPSPGTAPPAPAVVPA